MDYKNFISEKIDKILNIGDENIRNMIEVPPKSDMGDYAFPCFQLAKTLRKSPNSIAEDIKNNVDKDGFEKVEVIGPYVNFFINKGDFINGIVSDVINKGEKYGSNNSGENRKVLVEYSSPNIAKIFHIGHLPSTVIGNAIYKMFDFEGYDVVKLNHLGDWGTQYGKLISGYERWLDEDALKEDPIKELERLYVKFNAEAEKDDSLNDEARKHFKNLEDGKEEETELWQKFKDLSIVEFKRVYDMLGVEFDHFIGESFYSDKMDAVVKDLEDKGLLTDSNGAKVVMLEDYNMPPCIIKKSDGATIYATRDLASAIYRKNHFKFYKSIYVVGSPQSLHFKQFFTVLKLMGYDWAENCIHVGFGLVKFPEGKLSTRKGNVIYLEDLLNESVKRAKANIEERNPDLENKDEVAKKVGVGAVIFAYLKNNRDRDIIFDWNEMLSNEGETGPYVQYTYARGKSILRRAGEINDAPDFKNMNSQEELDLAKAIEGLPNAVLYGVEKYEPSIITRHVLEIAKTFNKFYNSCRIIDTEDKGLKSARLELVKASLIAIKNGLNLINVEVVDKM